MNDLATVKNCLGGCKVDQIGNRGKIHAFVSVCISGWVG